MGQIRGENLGGEGGDDGKNFIIIKPCRPSHTPPPKENLKWRHWYYRLCCCLFGFLLILGSSSRLFRALFALYLGNTLFYTMFE